MLFTEKGRKRPVPIMSRHWFYGLVCISVFHFFCIAAAISADAGPKLSKKEKAQVVRQAVDLYKKGDISDARQQLEKVGPDFGENHATPYYLGLIYLEQGQLSDAVSQWQRYVALAPHNENSLNIRKYLTLLRQDLAAADARKAIARESVEKETPVKTRSIVLTPFENNGYSVLGPLGKGMVALLSADLSKIPGLKVVDREKSRMVLKEMTLKSSGRVDLNAEAGRIGNLLDAEYVTTGEIVDLETEKMEISINLLDAQSGTHIATHKAEGPLLRFFDLQKKITCDVASSIGYNCKQLTKEILETHTPKLTALVAFAWGLDYRDKKAYGKAREMFQKALVKDPNFELAEQNLLDTPTSAMARKSQTQIIADLSVTGPDPMAAAVAKKSKWKRRTLMTAGALAVIAGGAALAGDGGDGGDGGDPDDLSDTWFATLRSSTDGDLDVKIVKEDDSVRAVDTPTGWNCLTDAKVDVSSWRVDNVSLAIRSSDQSKEVRLSVSGCSKAGGRCVSFSGHWTSNFSCADQGAGSGDGSFEILRGGGIVP